MSAFGGSFRALPDYSGTWSKGEIVGDPSDFLLIRSTVIGSPSDTYSNSYFLEFLSTAVQETLEICFAAKLPICLHVPAANSVNATGRPSAFGLSLSLKSIRSTGSSYRLSCGLRPLSPEKLMM